MWIECLTPLVLHADPIVTPLLILGMAGGMASQIHSGIQGKKQARENERRLKRQSAEALMLERRRSRFMIGEQRSMIAAGGVSLSSPTAIDVMASTAAYQEAEAQRAADPYRWEAEAQRTRGDQYLGASYVGAGQTALSGTSALAMRHG